ncbi:MAG: beta-ketoacyl-ACP synthase II [Candidatus Eisenbacteria bacterium]|uniref:3-oxoacyl-[acyl-carrier-protein] synthase 2 n=1 Tax=Eiseniibacteriota bacterium TaxID=2212470 RepID=A0A948W606_UNCEI|nr:beta-ketoacyl-ACP synthase II [Candidatus Eisenbacteria bacterium]MBU1948919.1 beta-ketoacyl-ACP synthase II [Candidatus Eisenbacteria bacterium]MBU2690595.1 beta-ketoacyl-ACP synthase II [Candidatus Eisenbacteria bacterium]
MKRRVVITGLGVLSPVGLNTGDFWDSLIEGRSGITRITKFDPSAFSAQIAGELKGFDPVACLGAKEARRTDAFVQYALVAAQEAFDHGKLKSEGIDPERFGVIIGSGIGGINTLETQHSVLMERGPDRVSPFFVPMMIADMASGQVSMKMNAKGPNFATVSACASGAHAIGEAFRVLREGLADVMLTGGAEAPLSPLALAGFCSMKALSTRNDDPERASRPFDKDRDGFVMAEGAGILLLETLEFAKARGATILAELCGYGATADAHHLTAPAPGGEGAARAMKGAMAEAGMKPEDVDYINAHGTSTPLNDRFETMAIQHVFGAHAKKLMVSSTKSMTGHLLGAAGGIETVACVQSLLTDIVPPTINYENPDPDCDLDFVPNEARRKPVQVILSNSLGFGGHNVSLLLKKYVD